jgi:RNA polymerase sigma-70 factor (ECF subfamily)
VTGEQHDEVVIEAWNEHRPYLVDLAFRMLGDIGAAEDVVQDAFWRLLRARPGEIEDERGWLIVVTSRLCLDQIRSARSRRERPHDAGEIEFVPAVRGGEAPAGREVAVDPADRVTLDDDVRLALLVMLQRLSPAERVVFVLHDIFGVPFESVAQTVGRPTATCRQLARRARQKMSDGQGDTRFDVGAAEHREVTEKFIAACAGGDPGEPPGGRAARAARVHRPGTGGRPDPDPARRQGPGRARHRRPAAASPGQRPARLSLMELRSGRTRRP